MRSIYSPTSYIRDLNLQPRFRLVKFCAKCAPTVALPCPLPMRSIFSDQLHSGCESPTQIPAGCLDPWPMTAPAPPTPLGGFLVRPVSGFDPAAGGASLASSALSPLSLAVGSFLSSRAEDPAPSLAAVDPPLPSFAVDSFFPPPAIDLPQPSSAGDPSPSSTAKFRSFHRQPLIRPLHCLPRRCPSHHPPSIPPVHRLSSICPSRRLRHPYQQ